MRSKLMYAALALAVVGLVVASAGSASAMFQDSGIAQTDAPETETLETAENESSDELENETEVEHEEDHIDGVDNATSFNVSQSDARATADAALTAPPKGSWSLTEISVHEADGYYEYEYALVNASSPGEAEVRVDGSTGDVFRFEQEIEGDEAPEEDIETPEEEGDEGTEGTEAEEEGDEGTEGTEAEEEGDEGTEAEEEGDEGTEAEEGDEGDEADEGDEGTEAEEEGDEGDEGTEAEEEGDEGDEGTEAEEEGDEN